MDITLMDVREMAHDVTEENAGRLAVHLEYAARHDPHFCTWVGLTSKATGMSYTPVGRRKEHLLTTLYIMEIEIRKQIGLRNYHLARRRLK